MEENSLVFKVTQIRELASSIFLLLPVSDLTNSRLVCHAWNDQITPILVKKCKIITIGVGLSKEADREGEKLKSLINVLNDSRNLRLFTKFHFGHLLDYDNAENVWDTQGPRILELTIDCHSDPEDTRAAEDCLKFTTENLYSILKKCGPSVENLQISLPWEIMENEDGLEEKESALMKCKRLLVHNAIFHNFCETQYPPIVEKFWSDFYSLCPVLTELNIEMDLNPEVQDSFIPMLSAMKTNLASTLTTLNLTVQISNDELKYFSKCNNLNLKNLSINKFHCTATSANLKKLIEGQKNSLESLKILIDIYYDANEIEFEELEEPNFGKISLPTPMENLKYLTLSYNDDECIHPPSRDFVASLKSYRIVCLEEFERLGDKVFLESMLPTNKRRGRVQTAAQINKIVICAKSVEEFQKMAVFQRAESLFPSATASFEQFELSSTLSFGIGG